MSNTDVYEKTSSNSSFLRFLSRIEVIGNKLPQPFMIFIILSILIILLSAILGYFEVGVSAEVIEKGKAVTKEFVTRSLLSKDGILYMLKNFIPNFTNFPALGTVFLMIACVGIAEKSGMIKSILHYVVIYTPKKITSAMVIFLGVMSSAASSAGYVVLIPLGGLIFMGFNRHPIAGVAAAFAGVSGGWGANLILGTSDVTLAGISTASARIFNTDMPDIPITVNWYFMIVSTFIITFVGALVTDKIVEPRLGVYEGEKVAIAKTTPAEVKALKWSMLFLLAYVLVLFLAVYPENSFLRNPETKALSGSPFISSLILFIAFGFALSGCVFGIVSKSITTSKDISFMMEDSVKQISAYLVLIIFAGQFVAYFDYSNLGIIFAVKGAHFFELVGIKGIFLVLGLVILTASINLLIVPETAKFTLISPIFTPMFMKLGLSPALTQVAYRIGDSSTNIISPIMPFFPLLVTLCQKYNQRFGVGSLISIMLPYSIAFFISWVILLVCWYFLGFDLGPGASLFYP